MKKPVSQQQRKTVTKRKLLDASAQVLFKYGFVGFTTTRVCAYSGMSHGALFKHFPTKLILIGALAEDIYATLTKEFEDVLHSFPENSEIFGLALRHLWNLMSSQHHLATIEMTLVARTNEELKNILEPIVINHRLAVENVIIQLLGKIASDNSKNRHMANLIHMGLQSLAIKSLLSLDQDTVENELLYYEELAKQTFGKK